MTRLVRELLITVAVFVLPFLWLAAMVVEYGLGSPFGFVTTADVVRLAWKGGAIGCFFGVLAGLVARSGLRTGLLFAGMVLVAGVYSWGLMFVVVAINSTSGHGIEHGYVLATVLSWALAFAGYFGAAGLVRVRWARALPRPTE